MLIITSVGDERYIIASNISAQGADDRLRVTGWRPATYEEDHDAEVQGDDEKVSHKYCTPSNTAIMIYVKYSAVEEIDVPIGIC